MAKDIKERDFMKKLLFTILFIFLHNMAFAQDTLMFGKVEENFDQLVSAEILKVVYQKLDLPVEIIDMPGKRSLKESNEGHIDGEVTRITEVSSEYPNLIKVPTPINYIEPSVFSIKSLTDISGCQSLKNYRIAIVRGLKHAELCTKKLSQVKVVNHLTKAFKLLEAERVDIVITSKINGLYLSNKLGLKTVKIASPSLSHLPVYHFVNKKHKALVPRINKLLLSMQANKTLSQLREEIITRLVNDKQLNIYHIK